MKESLIAYLRKRKGLTQRELAELIGVSDKAVSKWERGLSMPDVSLLPKLALILDTDAGSIAAGAVRPERLKWRGFLKLGSWDWRSAFVYDKPAVEILLSYFALVEVTEVVVATDYADDPAMARLAAHAIENGMSVDICASESSAIEELNHGSVIAVTAPFFAYGTNLTLKFRRAMARQNGVTVLSINYCDGRNTVLAHDAEQRIVPVSSPLSVDIIQSAKILPIAFCTSGELANYLEAQKSDERIIICDNLFVEPLRRGMVYFDLSCPNGLLSATTFVALMQQGSDPDIYNLESIMHLER